MEEDDIVEDEVEDDDVEHDMEIAKSDAPKSPCAGTNRRPAPDLCAINVPSRFRWFNISAAAVTKRTHNPARLHTIAHANTSGLGL